MNKLILVSIGTMLILMGLMGCSSQPVTLHYYLLDSVQHPAERQAHNELPIIIIDTVSLPEHLRSRSLVMQNNDETLSLATKHLWAQPLEDDIGNLLAKNIRRSDRFQAFYGNLLERASHEPHFSIAIVIEHFMPLSSGEVVMSGYWYSAQIDTSTPHLFDYRLIMEEDGYSHAVNKLRESVSMLAQDILVAAENKHISGKR
ncbi:PqiC family protein [Alteromonas facilis]|uniref:PqiC family protein n=1 Tax=Alteromonas facilis TaxID=2048004 RepID=UPI000C28235C|nr:ABC-type transport auxiliary lipoprotein family protein [Alteromonas facilis]